MSKIKLNYTKGNFLLESSKGKKFENNNLSPKINLSLAVNFYRTGNNFGYVRGGINFSENCDNNLVISDQLETTISKAKDSLIIIEKGNSNVFPIQEVEASYLKCLELLNGKAIIYNIPEKVLRRERLKRKNYKYLEEILLKNYRLHPIKLKKIKESIRDNGIFYISDGPNQYFFKYLGKDEKRVETISEIEKNIPSLFPAIKETVDGKAGIDLGDGIYGLEEFINGEPKVKRDLDYFTKLGRCIATMHEQLLKLTGDNLNLRKEFLTDAKHLSESNLVSLGIDLSLAGFEDINLEINRFTRLELSKKIESLPECLIHGDLNGSNVIITSNGFRFIDLENIKVSKRICELESPLIFGGNMAVPFYLEGSLKSIIEGYNCSAKSPLSNKEHRLIPDLIKYALVKNFVIRNIRRGEKINTKENLLANLSLLNNDILKSV